MQIIDTIIKSYVWVTQQKWDAYYITIVTDKEHYTNMNISAKTTRQKQEVSYGSNLKRYK
jgi:hypothetical protein